MPINDDLKQHAALPQKRRLLVEPPSLRADLYTSAVQLTGMLSRPFRFKGLWHVARYFAPVVGGSPMCNVAIGSDSRFEFTCTDAYWARLLAPAYVYEIEILAALQTLKGVNFSFLDCGANYGYWSVLCSDPSIGCRQVTAVEASASTFVALERNRTLNNDRFCTVNRAIFSRSGEVVKISQPGSDHASAGIAESGTEIETITIDDLSKTLAPADLIVIKLDVEGVEIAALEGARETLAGPVLVMFEDHGSDPTSKVCRFVLEHLGLRVFAHLENRGFVPVNSVNDVSALKTNRKKGYNFFAVTAAAADLFPSPTG